MPLEQSEYRPSPDPKFLSPYVPLSSFEWIAPYFSAIFPLKEHLFNKELYLLSTYYIRHCV